MNVSVENQKAVATAVVAVIVVVVVILVLTIEGAGQVVVQKADAKNQVAKRISLPHRNVKTRKKSVVHHLIRQVQIQMVQ